MSWPAPSVNDVLSRTQDQRVHHADELIHLADEWVSHEDEGLHLAQALPISPARRDDLRAAVDLAHEVDTMDAA